MTIGKVLDENKLVMRVSAGTATDEEGNEYELSNTLTGAPVVHLPNDRFVIYDWNTILNDAVKTFEEYEKQKSH